MCQYPGHHNLVWDLCSEWPL